MMQERRTGSTAAEQQQQDPTARPITTLRPPAGVLLSPMLEPNAGREGTSRSETRMCDLEQNRDERITQDSNVNDWLGVRKGLLR